MLDNWLDVLSMIGTLLLMAAVFVGAYYVSRAVGKRGGITRGIGHVEVLDKTMIGKEQSLLVVRAAGRVFLLGATASRIEKLEELEAQIFADQGGTPATPPPDFLSILKDALPKRRQDGEDE